MRVGILTGGGDCPGLNAVIRAIVRKGETVYGDEIVGFLDAWDGVLERRTMTLDGRRCAGCCPAAAPCSAPAGAARTIATAGSKRRKAFETWVSTRSS